jgi:hypothetical protein
MPLSARLVPPDNDLHLQGVFTLNKPQFSKLFKLKQWMTLSEAAKHLSGICGEEVTIADILRLALDRYLQLSVNFVNHTQAKPGKIVGPEEVTWIEFPSFKKDNPKSTTMIPDCLEIGDGIYLKFKDDVVSIGDVWDLPMIGSERLDVEHEYQSLTGGPEVTLVGIDGTFVKGEDGVIGQLQESYDDNEYQAGSSASLKKLQQHIASNNISQEKAQELLALHKEDRKKYLEKKASKPRHEDYYPAGGLPTDSVLVVRTEALREFEQMLNDHAVDKNEAYKYHGNTERFALNREQILGASLSVITQWPKQCQNSSGKFEATKIARLVDEKALLFWPETGEPPLSREKMEREISKWINKIGK